METKMLIEIERLISYGFTDAYIESTIYASYGRMFGISYIKQAIEQARLNEAL